MHKRIFTTVPKAKELRKFVEPIINVSKEDTTSARRNAFSKLQNKFAVTELFQTVSQKVGDRPGGYTRIIKTGNRLGDNASMCFIELVDFNENMLSESKTKKPRTRRSRRGGGSAPSAETTVKAAEAEVKTTKKESSKKDTSKAKSEEKVKDSNEAKETETKAAAKVETTSEVKDTKANVEEAQKDNNDTESSDNK